MAPNRSRTGHAPHRAPPVPRLPHPSWSGARRLADFGGDTGVEGRSGALTLDEFWTRLGL